LITRTKDVIFASEQTQVQRTVPLSLLRITPAWLLRNRRSEVVEQRYVFVAHPERHNSRHHDCFVRSRLVN
jgi:hypothetical protein